MFFTAAVTDFCGGGGDRWSGDGHMLFTSFLLGCLRTLIAKFERGTKLSLFKFKIIPNH